MKTLREMMDLVESAQKPIAEGWDPDTQRLEQDVRDALENGDDYTAKQYAKMAPTPKAKKYLLNIIKQAMYIDDLGGETDWKGVAEDSTGVSVRKWANQVRKDHGDNVKFWNRKEGGAVDSVIAKNSQGETVGVYNRKTGYPTVFEPKQQGVAEDSDELYQKAIRKYVQRVANNYLGGGNAHLYGANNFDSEMFGVDSKQAQQDFDRLFPQYLKKLQGGEQLEETTPDAMAKIDDLFRK